MSKGGPGGSIEQRVKREEFVRTYKKLCNKAFVLDDSYKGYKTMVGKQLVSLAREKMHYSKTTYSADIYRSLYKTFITL